MSNKFKIGDRVECVGSKDGYSSIIGKTGTIKVIDDDDLPYGIEFDMPIPEGHSLDGVISSSNGLFVYEEDIVLIKDDNVDKPSYYNDGKIEVIDYIEDKKLGFCLGNAIKYISRAGKKDPDKEVEDLKKAIWYINRRIKELTEDKAND